ncbi:MAG: hypothetical protein AAF762_09135 [Pseudomonadota bacterium]
MRVLALLIALAGCGGIAWDTTLAETPGVRSKMVESVVPGVTTETGFMTRWGRPTQKIREGGEVRYVYRHMRNPPEFFGPQIGNSADYVIVRFQYGLAVAAYSSDMEGCRGTFAPRPPGAGFDNPTIVHPVNCGPEAAWAAERAVAPRHDASGYAPRPGQYGAATSGGSGGPMPPGVPSDAYTPGRGIK